MTEKVLDILSKESGVPKHSIRVEFKGYKKNDTFTWLDHLILFCWKPRLSLLERQSVLNDSQKHYKEGLSEALKKSENLSRETNTFFFEINYEGERFMGWTTEEEILIKTKIEESD